ncbi:hypothetical protein VB796_12840 [Arcicella sp. LKC2W]|uniref:hypothetical protein n=1 Tax=Arcicella sp. LKC2W TaxID=2984198 RepID=UPI002B20D3FF|nr:hypothetical protein [Arcicella sp. LKC2W]MEA5459934.1 hypothetical protein [Arcicella sp. LKC2W]
MKVFCLEEFKLEFEKLRNKKSYKSIEKDIIDYFFGKSVEELSSGTRLNNSIDAPYIKKRLNGRGGFRCYFLLVIKDENLYLMFVHPKTGTLGSDNITDESKAYLYRKVYECIENESLYLLELNTENDSINFKKV